MTRATDTTKRRPHRRPIRPGARALDGKGTGTVLGNTGLPPTFDPRVWTWIEWDGSRGMQVARVANLRTTAASPA